MDRNSVEKRLAYCNVIVALRKESVDRNYIIKITGIAPRRSLSARRAWIEIHAEPLHMYHTAESLSARRAWIEIIIVSDNRIFGFVALRKESVDRNKQHKNLAIWAACRSPQGERG